MWEFFEPELRKRLDHLEIDDTMAARVRAALIELLPAGKSTVEDVAHALHTSARTIQRRLSEEETTYRKQLNHVRLLLAKQYLANTEMSLDTIAFMLDYSEPHSFVRAFTLWTGQSPTQYRAH
ncbi:helix-turn-helix transcriptional regulator [Schaalia suimastitidis]|uniref:helix-turn-helix transcriptional regulator n=1 Tax=Schaalia suimastitidis TaxID=121163 RepID=UPI0004056184|nr:helix-turn-helix transcriptional regulator [Schaalia suimastitidis]